MAILLLDTYSLLFRAFHAVPPMNTAAGTPTHALYGFSVLLLKLLREQRPEGVALTRDLPAKTFRHALYDGYKAGRPRAPSSLVAQLSLFEELVQALGFPLYEAAGFEADDVLATLAARFASSDRRVLVVSGDRDLLQTVDASVDVLFVGQRGKPPVLYDRARVEQRFGVSPAQLPSYVALVGDTSDNIPKLKGVGAATATALISRFGSIDALLARLPEVSPAKLQASIAEQRAQLVQSETLARLRRDVPLREPIDARPFDAAAAERTRACFEAWEFQSLLPRLAQATAT